MIRSCFSKDAFSTPASFSLVLRFFMPSSSMSPRNGPLGGILLNVTDTSQPDQSPPSSPPAAPDGPTGAGETVMPYQMETAPIPSIHYVGKGATAAPPPPPPPSSDSGD